MELVLTCLEPVLVAITLSGHKATDAVIVLESTDGNPQHLTQFSIDLQYWHIGNATSAMRDDAVENVLSRVSDRAAGYIGVSYYRRPGFGIGPSFPSIIPLDSMNLAGAEPVQVLNIIGTNPGSQLEGRWLLSSLGNDVTTDFTALLTAATTAACDRIIPLLDAAGPEQGFRYIYDPTRWSADTGPQPPPGPSLDYVAWQIRGTSLDEGGQAPVPRDWLRQEVLAQTTAYDRLELASLGDVKSWLSSSGPSAPWFVRQRCHRPRTPRSRSSSPPGYRDQRNDMDRLRDGVAHDRRRQPVQRRYRRPTCRLPSRSSSVPGTTRPCSRSLAAASWRVGVATSGSCCR